MKKVFAFVLLTISSILAQSNNLKFTHITTDDGLSQSNVKAIIQDRFGIIWFGTFDGLNKFDGYDFTIFKSDQNDTTSLISNSISCLFEDSQGILWIGTDQGACYYNRNKNIFTSFKNRENIPDGLIDGEVGAIKEDGSSNIWIATNKGLIQYNRKQDRFNKITDNNTKTVYIDSHNNIWAGMVAEGLNLLQQDLKTFTNFTLQLPNGTQTANYEVRAITEDKNEVLWIGTYGYGLTKVNLNNMSNTNLTVYEYDSQNSKSISSNLILSLFPDDDGLWIGTDNGGISFLSNYQNAFVRHVNNPDVESSLNNNSIYSILKDRAGDLWFGTFSGGINYINKTNQVLNCYRKIAGNNKSLASNTVRDFAEDKEGNIWVATDGGGLDFFSPNSNVFTHYNTSTTNLNRDAILTVFIDSKENIWVGTWDGGLSLFNRTSKSFKAYTKDNSDIGSKNIFDIDEDPQGRLWLASTDGLIMFEPQSQEFKTYTEANASLPVNHAEVVKVDGKGNILAGTTQGLVVFDPVSEKATTYRSDPKDTNSLSTGFVTALYEENSSVIWIGTINGINRLDRTTNKFQRYFEKDGLPNNSIRGISRDDGGNIWISTNKGISKFDPNKKSFKNFTKLDGIQGNEYVINSFYRTRKGRLLFGGVNGFDFFDPNAVVDNSYIPPVVVTDFQIFNKSIKPGSEDSPLSTDISETKEIVLSYKQSVFSFQFTALNYRASDKNQYAYMLQGFDNDWNYVGTKRSASYTNLDPGEYVFMVKGSNNDGVWNEKGTAISIIISPPFWATWWFRTIVILAIAAVIYFITKREKAKRKSLEGMNQKLEFEIKQNKEAEEEKHRLAEEARRKDKEVRRTLQEQQMYLQNGFDLLLAKMERFSEGDLGVSIEVRDNDSFSRLFNGFNKAVENFKKIILNLTDAIKSTASATDHINTTAEKIYEGTSEQSSRSHEVATSIEQMTTAINHSSKNSEMAAIASVEAKQIATDGGDIVKQTINGMEEISSVVNHAASTIKKLGDSSNKIGEIVELIDEIADQTNLLALNAAIEAARAGEHGRGFAVVADEVQKLSERTTAATKNIAEMIKQIQADSDGAIQSITAGLVKVNSGREYAERAGMSLDKIIKAVTQVSEVIEQVAAANEEQSAKAEQINHSILSINNVTKDNAVRVEQVTSAIDELQKLTFGLEELINKFEVGKQLSAGNSPRAYIEETKN